MAFRVLRRGRFLVIHELVLLFARNLWSASAASKRHAYDIAPSKYYVPDVVMFD